MKFFKSLNEIDDSQAPVTKPVPMRPMQIAALDEGEQLTDLKGVAKRLGVSKRFVESLVKAKAIPVIRLGRGCVRFGTDAVITAVKRFEAKEVQS